MIDRLFVIYHSEGTEYIPGSTLENAVLVFRRMTPHYRKIIRVTEYLKCRVINV
jgi:hypothetical protein